MMLVDTKTKRFVLSLLRKHNIMTIATIRPDGYPQATTVEYVNDGLTLYFACDRDSQKVANLKKNKKVSLTIDHEYAAWDRIQGLSMGAVAAVLTKADEIARARNLLIKKFPEMAQMSEEDLAATALVRVTPKVVSVIDYTRGFGHTDLVRV